MKVRLHAVGTLGNEYHEVATLQEGYSVVDNLVKALQAKNYKINWCSRANGLISSATMAHVKTGQCVSVDIITKES